MEQAISADKKLHVANSTETRLQLMESWREQYGDPVILMDKKTKHLKQDGSNFGGRSSEKT